MLMLVVVVRVSAGAVAAVSVCCVVCIVEEGQTNDVDCQATNRHEQQAARGDGWGLQDPEGGEGKWTIRRHSHTVA